MKTVVRVACRTREFYARVHCALRGTLGRDDFRIVHVSLQNKHLHLLVEASDRRALTRGMQSFTIRLARIFNRDTNRGGRVFVYRYHATQIRTARHARNALAYVLNNWRRHRVDRDQPTAKLDRYSSGVSFDGWRGGRLRVPPGYDPLPVSPPRTNLLGSEWQKFGLIDVWERPGPLR
jgi:putative transposase